MLSKNLIILTNLNSLGLNLNIINIDILSLIQIHNILRLSDRSEKGSSAHYSPQRTS